MHNRLLLNHNVILHALGNLALSMLCLGARFQAFWGLMSGQVAASSGTLKALP